MTRMYLHLVQGTVSLSNVLLLLIQQDLDPFVSQSFVIKAEHWSRGVLCIGKRHLPL